MKDTLNIGIAGLGTVGQGVCRILLEQSVLLEARCGRKLHISAVSARNKKKNRGMNLSHAAWHENPAMLAQDPNVDIVVELIGGKDGAAYETCKSALQEGKPVVTANKALIAAHGVELAKLAEKHKTALTFEAAVAGGIPIIKTLKEGLAANAVSRIVGILNGTCNYILTAMEKDGRDFDEVLKEAQELGYAEADPTFDVDGVDTAHKLAILTSLAFASPVHTEHMTVEGIRGVTLNDIAYARELGYRVRLLGIASLSGKGIEQRVHPCLVAEHSPLARVEGVLNAIRVDAEPLGPLFLEGAGAGGGPTASAVVADIIDIARGNASPAFGVVAANLRKIPFLGMEQHRGAYYLRLTVKDQPGVLAAVTSALGAENIGLDSVLQKKHKQAGRAQIVLTTFEAGEAATKNALRAIARMEYVLEPPHVIRIEEV